MHLRDDARAGGEEDRARGRADEGLDQIVGVIHRRNLVREEFDAEQHHEGGNHPTVLQRIPRRFELNPVGEASGEGNHEQREISVQPGTAGKAKGGENVRQCGHRLIYPGNTNPPQL